VSIDPALLPVWSGTATVITVTGYRGLADQLRARIKAGEYLPESTLPKQEELAKAFQVNVKTVRQAVAVLESEGLVTPIRRRGTVVRGRPPMRRLGVDRYAKSNWKFAGLAVTDRVVEQVKVQVVEADSEVAKALHLGSGELVVERARLLVDQGAPTHTLTSYYHLAVVEGTPLASPDSGAGASTPVGGFQVLALRGFEPDRITESLHARMPTPTEREALKLPAGEPVVVLHRTTWAVAGVPVEFARGVYAASRFTWTYDFKIPE
jgi:GntR family transcriptional regulator